VPNVVYVVDENGSILYSGLKIYLKSVNPDDVELILNHKGALIGSNAVGVVNTEIDIGIT
jgi:hypothetical protein